MNRREALQAGAVALLGGSALGAAGTALGYGPFAKDQPEYLEEESIVYERPPLELTVHPAAVNPGDLITFKLHHRGDTQVFRWGCELPWAIQRYEDGAWHHAEWTRSRWDMLCDPIGIEPGETITIPLTLSEEGLADEPYIDEVDITFTPGTYRFIVLHLRPALAVNFQILHGE